MSHPGIDRPAPAWTGRDDGPGPEHARWFSVMGVTDCRSDDIHTASDASQECRTDDWSRTAALIGFASDEGVRRNHGRVGAAEGPAALRAALGSLAAPPQVALTDLGDVVVDSDLEAGHERLGQAVAAALDSHDMAIVLGGGHEVAYGTYRGVAAAQRTQGRRHGVFNVDAHFDLRRAERATSGTPFLQMFDDESAAGRTFTYAVAGISRANNTQVLFDTAERLGVRVLEDDACDASAVDAFVDAFLAEVDVVHLTIDLDAMPAADAPGVSAPAAFGVPVAIVRRMVRRLAASGRLAAVEIAELNPRFDIDQHTAKLAGRLIDDIVRHSC